MSNLFNSGSHQQEQQQISQYKVSPGSHLAMLDLSQAHIMAPPLMTMIAVQSSLESHLPGALPSQITSFPTVCEVVCRELCSQSLNAANILKHSPAKNSLYPIPHLFFI